MRTYRLRTQAEAKAEPALGAALQLPDNPPVYRKKLLPANFRSIVGRRDTWLFFDPALISA